MKDLFSRPFNDCFNSYTNQVKQNLNLNTIKKWSKRKTFKFYNFEYETWYLQYRFHLLFTWFHQNIDDINLLELKLDKLIRILKLEQYLNAYETNYLFQLNSNKFTKLRNIKSLITNFDLEPKEVAYFHYLIDSFVFNQQIIDDQVAMYITSYRIVVITKQSVISFYFGKNLQVKVEDNYLKLKYFNHDYYLLSNKIKIIETSLQRIKRI